MPPRVRPQLNHSHAVAHAAALQYPVEFVIDTRDKGMHNSQSKQSAKIAHGLKQAVKPVPPHLMRVPQNQPFL